MMSENKKLFKDFEKVSSKQWKQQIQFDLKGADYNETLVWESLEGIKVKPFYHYDESVTELVFNTPNEPFLVSQKIFVHDVVLSNKKAKEVLQKGADVIYFILENDKIEPNILTNNLPKEKKYHFTFLFLNFEFIAKLDAYLKSEGFTFTYFIDPIFQLTLTGNWFIDQKSDLQTLEKLNQINTPFLQINLTNYQNAGANIVQQLAYALAHVHEYIGYLKTIQHTITFEVAVGSNYFFEIAKLRALRILANTLLDEYKLNNPIEIIATPSQRNKTIYDYNVNMLRTTTECMASILGGANEVINIAYDSIYHKDNEFGDRIARNQLLILKEESYLDVVNNAVDGSYYIESLTEEFCQKALQLFKDIEANDGLISQLINGTIQKKISESADKEQSLFDQGKEILLGTNKYPNAQDKMKNELQLFPFVKQNNRKTLIAPLINKRLAEKIEQERLHNE
jgi:methylmalonyl-CoA mutase